MDYLIQCIEQGKLGEISDFIRRLSNINKVLTKEDEVNMNLLHIASGVESVFRDDVVNLIVKENGLEINQPCGPGNDFFTAAHIAACNGYSTTLKCLLAHGADPYLVDIEGNTVWDVATNRNQHNCILILENAVKNPHSPKKDIEDSIYFSFDSLRFDDEETLESDDQETVINTEQETLLPSEDSSVIYVMSEQSRLASKVEEKLSQKSPGSMPIKSIRKAAEIKYRTKIDPPIKTGVYTDNDCNVTLVTSKETTFCSNTSVVSSEDSILSQLDSDLNKLTNMEIRQKLQSLGLSPGPVNETTRNVYLRKLGQFSPNKVAAKSPISKSSIIKSPASKSPISKSSICKPQISKSPLGKSPTHNLQPLLTYSPNINRLILEKFNFDDAIKLEEEFEMFFSNAKGPRDFFNYLLLDPRETRDLSQRIFESQNQKLETNLFVKFLKAIFYIGKGKANRPYMHLYEAALPKTKPNVIRSSKVKRITEIWDQGYGVISHHLFMGMSSDEAFARESLMIDAIGLNKLTNIRQGQNKMLPKQWTVEMKMTLGAFFLWRACGVLKSNGERQIKRSNFN